MNVTLQNVLSDSTEWDPFRWLLVLSQIKTLLLLWLVISYIAQKTPASSQRCTEMKVIKTISGPFSGVFKCSASTKPPPVYVEVMQSKISGWVLLHVTSWKPTGSRLLGFLVLIAWGGWFWPFSLSSRWLHHQEAVESDAGALCRAAGPGGGRPEGQPHHQGHAHNSRGRQRNSHQVRGLSHTNWFL